MNVKRWSYPFGLPTGVLVAALLLGPVCPDVPALAQTDSLVPAGDEINDTEARFELARLLSRNESTLDQAVTEYRRVLAASPGDSRAILELADVLARMRRYQDALKLLESITLGSTPRPESVSLLGDIRLYSGDIPGAVQAYSKAYSLKPTLPGLELKLAQALSWSGRQRAALPLLRHLHAVKPEDTGVAVLFAQALAATGNREQAAGLVAGLLAKRPHDVDILLTAADIQAGMGHAKDARGLFERAEILDPTGKARAVHGDRSIAWGDFHRAEDAVRAEIATRGNARELSLKLASVLSGAQRYEEAAILYDKLLSTDANDMKSLAGLAKLRLLEKNPSAALELAGRMSQRAPGFVDALRLEAQAKSDSGDLEGALIAASAATERPGAVPEDFSRLGDLFQRKGQTEQAVAAYRRAAGMEPPDPWAVWKISGEQDSVLPDDSSGLSTFASELKTDGRFEAAGRLYRKALKRDPENFQAQMGLAELLATTGWYGEALAILDQLAKDNPGVSKVLLTRARVLGWAKRYDESLAAYDALHRMRPEDPVPLREEARTAVWGKKPTQAVALYSSLEKGNYPDKVRQSAELERTAKMEGFERRFSNAKDANDKLLSIEPGNQEALFDRAQAACALGLCDEEEATYRRLLAVDPRHTMAGQAVDRLRWRNATSVKASFSAWDEDGKSGRLAQITRYRWDMEVNVPIEGRYYLRAAQNLWLEDPKTPKEAQQSQGQGQTRIPVRRFDGSYLAEGQTVGAGGKVNQWLSGDFSFTNKQYFDAGLRPLYSGLARIEANLRDVARLAVFYQRTDEITNDMSLAQGIQIDNWGASVLLQPTRRVEFSFQGRYQNYSDGNQGTHLKADAGVTLTDHPHELKLTATGEYRDTRDMNKFVYVDGNLITIIHPYWTPQRYYSGAMTLGWRHDLAKDFFCGARQHFYGLQFSGGTDTDNNPFWRLEAEYVNDFSDRWSLSLKGLIHRSQQWDALGAWTGLTYRF
ncbi:MAG: tetratricopeptide repeat protein [Desulfovibrio sp.]|nr:tetratricopeptide repeat protein [Desulfovibrio sp.]MBI4960758.1 tetratricopeptide repeat protein [Desulfovibrio sp.]